MHLYDFDSIDHYVRASVMICEMHIIAYEYCIVLEIVKVSTPLTLNETAQKNTMNPARQQQQREANEAQENNVCNLLPKFLL